MPAAMTWRRRRGTSLRAATATLALALTLPQVAAAANTTIEGEGMSFNAAWGHLVQDGAASGGQALELNANGYASATLTTSDSPTYLFVRARGDLCNGPPTVSLKIDG